MKQMIFSGLAFCISLLCCSSCSEDSTKTKELPHVIVIGVDGLGAHGLSTEKKLPFFDFLKQNGAYSLTARTIMPSVSAPSWTTLFTGTIPERHSVGTNDWRIHNRPMEPVFQNESGLFPTMFGAIRTQHPEAVIGAIYHWGTISELIEKEVCNVSIPAGSEDEATQKACDFIIEKKPHLTFVHLDHQDHAGHSMGYRSETYFQSVVKTDSIIGVFIETLKKAELLDKTVLFIVSDHGGIEKGHGGPHKEEMEVPFIIYGAGVKKGYKIDRPVFNYDLAPTIEWLFDVTPNEWVVGKPLKEAFEDK